MRAGYPKGQSTKKPSWAISRDMRKSALSFAKIKRGVGIVWFVGFLGSVGFAFEASAGNTGLPVSEVATTVVSATTNSSNASTPQRTQSGLVTAVEATSGASFNLSDLLNMRYREDLSEVLGDEQNEEVHPGDFVFAIEETGSNEAYLAILKPLVDGLRLSFPDRHVILRQIPSQGFAETVKNEHIPFVVATSGTMVVLMDVAGAVPLAARERTAGDDRTATAAGGLLIVDANRHDLETLESLKGARVAVASSVAFGPWQWLQGRLLTDGMDPAKYFSAIWRLNEVPDVFNAIASGRADVGLLETCTYERMVERGLLDPEAFRPVAMMYSTTANAESRETTPPVVCRSSTPLIPDWTLGYLPSAKSGAVRRVAAVAFSIPEGEAGRWGTRVDLSNVRILMQALHWGPYAYLDEQSFAGFVRRHSEVFLSIFAIFAFVLFHALRSRHLVRVKTRDLKTALEEKNRMEEEARVTRERLSAIERVGLLSQMSSMFAHELKQPLSSLSNYIGGLRLWNARQKMSDADRKMTEEALTAMAEETSRITEIVNRVRGYARASTEPLAPVDWGAIIRRAIGLIERHDARRVPIFIAPSEWLAPEGKQDAPAMVLGDALELELLVLNLVRNAAHAAMSERDGFVSVSLIEEDGRFILHVTDNGPRLSEAGFARLTGYGDSVKQEGLGIGLSICRGIADRHGAVLHFHQLPTQGICAEVVIEAIDADEATTKAGGDAK